MSNTKLDQIEIKEDTQGSSEHRITSFEDSSQPVIKNFEYNKIVESGHGNYSSNKAKFGPLAVTDVEREFRAQKDRRFSLNPLLKNPLSIEQEEKKVMDAKVQERIREIEKEAEARGIKNGYEVGLKKGVDEALEQFRSQGASHLKKFEELVMQFENAQTEVFAANEKFLIELVFRISKTILLKELTVDKQYVQRLAKELVHRMGTREYITIKISQNDADILEEIKSGLVQSFGQLTHLNIEVSPEILQGGCRVETDRDAIEASIEKQMEEISASLLGNQNERDGGN